jgi:hypothetical protein
LHAGEMSAQELRTVQAVVKAMLAARPQSEDSPAPEKHSGYSSALAGPPQEIGGEAVVALLPCPFCGGKADFDHDDDGWNWIECSQCHVSSNSAVHAMEDCHPMLAETWNRRSATTATVASRDADEAR